VVKVLMAKQRLWQAMVVLFLVTGWVYAGTITVNSVGDTNTRDDVITFREAIMLSEGILGFGTLTPDEKSQVSPPVGREIADTINFGISGSITPNSGLPEITDDGTVIDASSQWNSVHYWEVWPGGRPGVVLDGRNAGNTNGLAIIGAANCHIRGLLITSFSTGVLIHDGAQSNIVGGPNREDRNIISGNSGPGLIIAGSGTDSNIVAGNCIGTYITDMADLGNSGDAVIIGDGAQSNTIGGTTVEESNIISGNDSSGVYIYGSTTRNNLVRGNYIGTDINGVANLGNTYDGVVIGEGAQSNIIGGTSIGAGNTIAFNKQTGVVVRGAGTHFNSISGNSIHHNGGQGIDLFDGGNDEIEPPNVIWASLTGDFLTVSGDNISYNATVEFFKADYSGMEGQIFLGSLTTDEDGKLSGSLSVAGKGISVSECVTATITHTNGNTSEYSPGLIWTEFAISPPVPIRVDGRKLSVGEDGILYHDGKPFRAVGVNYNDPFLRVMEDPNDTSYIWGFAQLAVHGIPFVRFMATTHWAVRLAVYETDRETYLQRLDGVVRAAEDYGIGLIPSFFWQTFTVPDLVGEPVNQWGNPNSKTIAFMRRYTRDIVSRYRDSPAVWVWEFGNEFSLAADLPNAAQWRPPIVPELGTPLTRGPDDDLTTDMIVTAFREFAEVVRSTDPVRPITTGNSIPRNHAEDIRLGNRWSKLDTRDEFKSNISLVNPAPHDMVSIHIYPEEVTHQRFTSGYHSSYSELIALAMEASRQEGKALFMGEYGANDFTHGGAERAAQANQEMLDALVENDVALSAIWVYDMPVSDDPASLGWNIKPPNRRMYLLDAIREANEAISGKSGNDQITNYIWDVNEDGSVNVSDIVLVAQHFGEGIAIPLLYSNPDVNSDGTVDILDIVLVASHFGEVYSPAAPPRDMHKQR